MTTTIIAATPTSSTPFAWYERIEGTLEFLKDPAFAIRFALDHVDPGMVRDFMEDWQADHDTGETRRTRHWLEGMREDMGLAEEEEPAETPTFEPDYSDMRAFNRNLAEWRRSKAQQ